MRWSGSARPRPTRCRAGAIDGEPVRDVPALVVATAIFQRSGHKYRDRTYRYVLADLGHALENLRVAAGALGVPAPLRGRVRRGPAAPECSASTSRRKACWRSSRSASGQAPVLRRRHRSRRRRRRSRTGSGGALADRLAAIGLRVGVDAARERPGRDRRGPCGDLAARGRAAPRRCRHRARGDAARRARDRRDRRRASRRRAGRARLAAHHRGAAFGAPLLRRAAAAAGRSPRCWRAWRPGPARCCRGRCASTSSSMRVAGLAPGAYRYEPPGMRSSRRRAAARPARADARGRARPGRHRRRRRRCSCCRSIAAASLPIRSARRAATGTVSRSRAGRRAHLPRGRARGLGACAVGAFYDDEAAALVGVDPAREWVLHFAAVGIPDRA